MTEPRSSMRTGLQRAAWMVLVLVLVCVGGPRAQAHDFRPALLQLTERPGPGGESSGVFDLRLVTPALSSTGPIPEGALTVRAPAHCERRPGVLDCGQRGLVGELVVEGLDRHLLDVLVDLRFADGTGMTAVLGPDAPNMALGDAASSSSSSSSVVWTYLVLGVEHIGGGFDHLLFVFGLVLLVRETKTLVWTVTAFTLAHSLTLAGSALALLSLPSPPVEAGIALSILLLARELALEHAGSEGARDSLSFRSPWLVAFVFGLLHGFGFAGALVEIGLPSDQLPLALLSFNLGVEAGQLVVVATLLLLFAGLRGLSKRVEIDARIQHWGRAAPIYAMGGLAFAWTLERVLGMF